MANKKDRKMLTIAKLRKALTSIWKSTHFRQKDDNTPELASIHEIVGMLREEINGIEQTVYTNQPKDIQLQHVENLGVLAICAVAALQNDTTDW